MQELNKTHDCIEAFKHFILTHTIKNTHYSVKIEKKM